MTKPQTRELARRFGLDGRRQAGQPGHLLRADRALHRHHRPAAAECDRARRYRRSRRPRHRPASGHRSFHRRPAARTGHRLQRAALCGAARCRAAAASWSARARRLRMDRIVLRDVNWIGDGALDRAVGEGLEIFVRVRSTRAPQPAWLRAADGGYEVELVAGEEGVSPGPGLRVLRCALGPGARARRRLHPERHREGAASARSDAQRAAGRGDARINSGG